MDQAFVTSPFKDALCGAELNKTSLLTLAADVAKEGMKIADVLLQGQSHTHCI